MKMKVVLSQIESVSMDVDTQHLQAKSSYVRTYPTPEFDIRRHNDTDSNSHSEG